MELKIEVDLVADMTVYNPFDFFVEDIAEEWPFSIQRTLPRIWSSTGLPNRQVRGWQRSSIRPAR
jgi:hypothetical protein